MFLLDKLKAEFTNYMKKALKNDSIDYFRAERKKNNIHFTSLESKEVKKVSMSQDCDVDTFFDSSIRLCEISNYKLFLAMKNLTSRQQEIIYLYANGNKISDIAKKLNISVGTVKATISQVKYKIKKYMEEN